MEQKLKCEDYQIFKIRYYADEKLLKLGLDNSETMQQHWNRAQEFNKFIWCFIEEATGKKSDYFYLEYPSEARECAYEILREDYGILKSDCEGDMKLFIPKENLKLIEWIKTNLKLPYKIIKKTGIKYLEFHDNSIHRDYNKNNK